MFVELADGMIADTDKDVTMTHNVLLIYNDPAGVLVIGCVCSYTAFYLFIYLFYKLKLNAFSSSDLSLAYITAQIRLCKIKV